jgi:hypothetical protein
VKEEAVDLLTTNNVGAVNLVKWPALNRMDAETIPGSSPGRA